MIKTVKNKVLYEQELSIEDIIHNFSPVATHFAGNIVDGFTVTIQISAKILKLPQKMA